jgi:hypothetical protein
MLKKTFFQISFSLKQGFQNLTLANDLKKNQEQ